VTDALASPRSLAQAAREMVGIAIANATDEEIVAVRDRLGPWVLEKVLDVAAGDRPGPDPVMAEPSPRPRKAGFMKGRRICFDADRVQLALMGLRESFERKGVPWTSSHVASALGRRRVAAGFLAGGLRRLPLADLERIEALIEGGAL
jgi:hypothetical protein